MNWEPHMDTDTGYITKFGLVSPPYRVGKFILSGEVRAKYGLWNERELIGYFPTFELAAAAADEHRKAQGAALCDRPA